MNYIITVYMFFTADWVAYSGYISILEQHFVFTEVLSCLLSHLYWLLLAHQCFFNFSISVKSPFFPVYLPSDTCSLLLLSDLSAFSSVDTLGCFVLNSISSSFFPYSLTLLQCTSSHLSRKNMRQNCGMLVYLKLCPHLDWVVWRALEF